MAEAKLNFDEALLDKSSKLYDLYSRLYEGMSIASKTDTPKFNAPTTTPEGEVDITVINDINNELAKYSEILMKNSAYLFANSIVTVIGEGGGSGGGGSTVGMVSRSGDSMIGNLAALYGFQAGYNGQTILDAIIDAKKLAWINITGNLSVSANADIKGQVNLSDNGIYFGKTQTIYKNQNTLTIASQDIVLQGAVKIDGSLNIGKISLTENGIFNDVCEYYHAGNSNKIDVDWTMNNSNVNGTLSVTGTSSFTGSITSSGGFSFTVDGSNLLYSVNSKDDIKITPYIELASDLSIIGSHGIKVSDTYVVKVKSGAKNIVSFTAPGMVMSLGDSEGDLKTEYIALQTAIKNYNGANVLISQYGDGYFPNSFKAGCSNSGPTVISTFYSKPHYGIVISGELRLGSASGPSVYENSSSLTGTLPYIHMVNDVSNTDHLKWNMQYVQTSSLFRDLSKPWSATLQFDTEAEFIAFAKPVESTRFAIKSENYKTCLIENVLFFDDGKFIEGVKDGLKLSGNAYFSGSLSSPKFASGFAGYGWAIKENATAGGYAATFDELTIRKKMRVYELEVQKSSVTNGSLWVSDSCSGDEVRVL